MDINFQKYQFLQTLYKDSPFLLNEIVILELPQKMNFKIA